MRMKVLRVRIPDELYKQYKILCVNLELSLPKQTTQIIESFVLMQQENYEKLKGLKK